MFKFLEKDKIVIEPAAQPHGGLTASIDVAKMFHPPLPPSAFGPKKPEPEKFGPGERFADEEELLAHRAGVAALAPIYRRLKALESEVQELKQAQTAPHLRNVEKRTKI